MIVKVRGGKILLNNIQTRYIGTSRGLLKLKVIRRSNLSLAALL